MAWSHFGGDPFGVVYRNCVLALKPESIPGATVCTVKARLFCTCRARDYYDLGVGGIIIYGRRVTQKLL